MKTIKVSHDAWIQLKLGGAVWLSKTAQAFTITEGEIIDVMHQIDNNKYEAKKCMVTQITPNANDEFFYRLVETKD